jgi:hypothetical protein
MFAIRMYPEAYLFELLSRMNQSTNSTGDPNSASPSMEGAAPNEGGVNGDINEFGEASQHPSRPQDLMAKMTRKLDPPRRGGGHFWSRVHKWPA